MERINERRVNGLTAIIAAKAISSPLCLLIGLIFSKPFFLVYGAGLGLIGLMMLIIIIASEGLRPTLRTFRSLFQGFFRDVKIAFGKVLPKREESTLRLKFTTKGILREFEMPNAPEFLRKTTDFFLSYEEYPKEGVPLLVKSVKPETENDQLKAVTIELGTISIRKILAYRIRLFAYNIKEAIKGIRRKDC
jgi:hypothetical protein